MKKIKLSHDCEFVAFDEVGRLMAVAKYPDESMLLERMNHDWLLSQGLLEAVRSGRLSVRDRNTCLPLAPDCSGVKMLAALVSVNDLQSFFSDAGYAVEFSLPIEPETATASAEQKAATPVSHSQDEKMEPTQAVPVGTKKWTNEALDNISAYRKVHGTKAAAQHFGISEARVRALLPKRKCRPRHRFQDLSNEGRYQRLHRPAKNLFTGILAATTH